MCFFLAFIWFKVQGSRFKVQGLGGGFAAFFYWGDARKWYLSHQSLVTPTIRGEWIVSHVWHEILRLSPHLFWLGVFTHRAFSSAQDDDTGERVVSQGGGFAASFIGAMSESGIQVTGYQS